MAYDENQDTHGKTCFFRLPLAARVQIWKHSLAMGARLLAYELSRSNVDRVTQRRKFPKRKAPFDQTLNRQPAILSVCRESRAVAHSLGVKGVFGQPEMWWFPASDRLYFQRPCNFLVFVKDSRDSPEHLRIVRNVAILGHDRIGWTFSLWHNLCHLVSALTRLDTIHVLVAGAELDMAKGCSEPTYRETFGTMRRLPRLKRLGDEAFVYDTNRQVAVNNVVVSPSWNDIRAALQRCHAKIYGRGVNMVAWDYQRTSSVTISVKERERLALRFGRPSEGLSVM